MQARQYSKIKTSEYLKGEFVIDVLSWDGEQPQIENPAQPGEYIDDPAVGITDKPHVPGCYIHLYTPAMVDGVEDWINGTWGEGDPDADDKRLSQSQAAAKSKRITEFEGDIKDGMSLRQRLERHASELRQGKTTTDDITALDAYAQELRDMTTAQGWSSDPLSVVDEIIARRPPPPFA